MIKKIIKWFVLILPMMTLEKTLAKETPELKNSPKETVFNVGDVISDFQATGYHGQVYNFINDLKGKVICLEWTNKDCPSAGIPYYKKSTLMHDLQKKYGAKGVMWFVVISSAEGKEGYLDPQKKEDLADLEKYYKNAKDVIIDKDGKLARQFGAKVTTTIAVIDPSATFVYRGAATNKKDKTCYVSDVLDTVLKGGKVTLQAEAKGCSIKFSDKPEHCHFEN